MVDLALVPEGRQFMPMKDGFRVTAIADREAAEAMVGLEFELSGVRRRLGRLRRYYKGPCAATYSVEVLVSPSEEAAAKLAQAKEGEEEEESKVSRSVVGLAYRQRYGKAAHCGDQLADHLGEFEVADVLEEAQRLGLVTAGQYDHLNPGMRRMNAGNKIRGYLKRAPVDQTVEILGVSFRGGAVVPSEG